MILPFMGALNLTLMIPGQPTTTLVAQALFIGFAVLLVLMRRLPMRFKFTELEFWVLALTMCAFQAYLRNPVGLNIFGGGSVGGRPYAIYGITLLSCTVLSVLVIPVVELNWLLRLSIFGGLANFVLNTIGYFSPMVGMWYGAVDPTAASASGGAANHQGQYGVDRATRIGFLGTASRNIALWTSSFISPIRACFHPLWLPLILLSFAFAALSGYRNEIASVGLTYLVALAYRGGVVSVVVSLVALCMGLAVLSVVNMTAPLPANIQRSFSFLPGSWDQQHIQDAEDSTEWRVEMWEEALLTDHWIKNKMLGDGLGMTQQELNYIQSFAGKQISGAVGTGKLTMQQEFMMATGSYHSGPVSTIRAIGYFGLFVFLVAQIRLAVHAHRQVLRCRKTEWFPVSLFVGIPLIWSPVFFVLIFGDFGMAAATFLFGFAMVRILENNLPLPTYGLQKNQPGLTLGHGGSKTN